VVEQTCRSLAKLVPWGSRYTYWRSDFRKEIQKSYKKREIRMAIIGLGAQAPGVPVQFPMENGLATQLWEGAGRYIL
jgi:hypothetical protein